MPSVAYIVRSESREPQKSLLPLQGYYKTKEEDVSKYK